MSSSHASRVLPPAKISKKRQAKIKTVVESKDFAAKVKEDGQRLKHVHQLEKENPGVQRARDNYFATTDQRCFFCQCDSTASSVEKGHVYDSPEELRAHVKTDYHTRKAQVTRGFKTAAGAGDDVACPLCGEVFTIEEQFLEHFDKEHPEDIWKEAILEDNREGEDEDFVLAED